MSGRRPVVKIIAESLSQHDEKHVVPTLLSGIRIGGRRFIFYAKQASAMLVVKSKKKLYCLLYYGVFLFKFPSNGPDFRPRSHEAPASTKQALSKYRHLLERNLFTYIIWQASHEPCSLNARFLFVAINLTFQGDGKT
jgi:hypothetical protein